LQLLIFRQDAPLISPHPAHLAAELYRASGLVLWPKADVTARSTDVGVSGMERTRAGSLGLANSDPDGR
jgi:hypothetical protein